MSAQVKERPAGSRRRFLRGAAGGAGAAALQILREKHKGSVFLNDADFKLG